MDEDYLISVIIPVYNVEKYISKCLDSVIKQTYKNLEIIIIDDGSTDKSGFICDEYKKIDSRIRVIHHKNKGLSYARNEGISNSNGSFISFVDSDDYLESNMFYELKNNIILYNSDISMCNFYYEKGNKKRVACDNFKKDFVVNNNDKYNYIYNKYDSLTIHTWNKLYKKNIFNSIRFPVNNYFEDSFIICDLLEKANVISYLHKPLYNYVYRDNSIFHSFSLKHFDNILASNKRIEFYENHKLYNLINIEKNRKAINIITYLIKMRFYRINNEEIYMKYYDELNKMASEMKWKIANKYVKRFKIFKKLYIDIRYLEYYAFKKIK